jgi:hypothetical protein
VNRLPSSHHKHVLLVYISYAGRRPDLSQPTVVSFEFLQDASCVYIYSWLTLEKWLLIRESLVIERHDAHV